MRVMIFQMSHEVEQGEVMITNRRQARYELAELLMGERFTEATQLADELRTRNVIRAEDHTFVQEIVLAAQEH